MADLKCTVQSCVHNNGLLCCKGDICVGGRNAGECSETCCESFSLKREDRDRTSSSLEHASNTILIDCEASGCVHNSNLHCMADRVTIEGNGANSCGQTECATFCCR